MFDVMRYLLSLFIVLFVAVGSSRADSELLTRLKQIKEVSGIKEMNVEGFAEYYEFWFEQPVDHGDASRGTFRQRVLLGHRDFAAPVVAELEGYGIHSEQAGADRAF